MSTSKNVSQEDKEGNNENHTSLFVQALLLLVFILRIIVDWFVDFIFSMIYKEEDNLKLPGVKNPLLLKNATLLAQEIREKKVSSEEVVSAHVNRIKEINKLLNAVVDERFNDAIEDAKVVDKFLAETDLTPEEINIKKPFLGVPFTSKESTKAKGMFFSCGLVSRKGVRATEDAVVVEKMKESGAILIAVTNVPELNLWCETRNNVYGQTNNPYKFSRTTGGSTGGESSLIAACGSPLGIGTDIGGSIRMPAYFCGVFGHKPSNGLITTKGLTFRTGEESETMVTAGTLSRSVKDITPFLKVLLGENVKFLKLDEKVNLQDIKVSYCLNPKDLRVSSVSKDVVKCILKVVDHLSTISKFHVDKINLNGFKYSLSLWRHEMSLEPSNFALDLGNREGEVSLKTELPKTLLFQSNYTLPAIMRLVDLKILPPTKKKWAEKERDTLKKEVLELLGDNGVLLFPSCPTEAPYHYASFFRPYNFAYWAIFNVLKLPVTQVPLGLTKNGLPVGLQIVAAPNNDHLTIAVAEELEKTFGGWVPPFTQ
ncbi:fatty-acid amide hydrolase 2 [Halyomorpha halys]|uniref:fatty-acid amide hydrolase 2 n=1 Tax=Halyomorpha halys TaxID=286706 RepID=UPI0006D4D7E0|nr:fatty-acid amide hydrolase 2 [Halyomorpha halys]